MSDETIPARPGSRTPITIPTDYNEEDLIAQRPPEQVTVNTFVANKQQDTVRPAKRLPPGQATMDHEEEQVGSVPASAPASAAQEPELPSGFSSEELAQALQLLHRGVIPLGPQSLNPQEPTPDSGPPVPAKVAAKTRVIYQLPGGHNIRLTVREVLLEPGVVAVISDADSSGMAVTPAMGRMGLKYNGTVYSVLYAGAEFEYNGDLFQVFQRIPDE